MRVTAELRQVIDDDAGQRLRGGCHHIGDTV
jgi:hypothetical protein